MMIGVGGSIGTGLFLGSGVAIAYAGPLTVLAYLLCVPVALVIGWALAEMVVVHPRAGSFGTIAGHYLGSWAGFVVRWMYWMIQSIGVGAAITASGTYVQYWWPQLPLWPPVVGLTVAVVAINALSVGRFGTVEYGLSVIKVAAIVVFILTGVVAITLGLPHQAPVGLANLTGHGGFVPNRIGGLAAAFVVVIFSYGGIELVAAAAAESANPRRDIPRATTGLLAQLALLYCLGIGVVLAIMPWTQTARLAGIATSPFVRLFEIVGVPAAAGIMNFVVLTAALSGANTGVYAATRMMHALALDGQAPIALARLTPAGTPRRALLATAVAPCAAAIISVIAPRGVYVALLSLSVFGLIIVWLLILATHLAFRRSRTAAGHTPGAARLWGAPATTVGTIVVLGAALLSTAFIPSLSLACMVGPPFLALLVLAYLVLPSRPVCPAPGPTRGEPPTR